MCWDNKGIFFFEPLRRAHHVCVTRKPPQTEETVRHCARQRNRAKDHAPQERRGTLNQLQPRDKTNRQILHSASFSKHTTRPPVHTSACLKHSNFVNTDRMRKRDGPTAVHMNPFSTSVFNNSDRDVSSSFRTAQILRQRIRAPKLVEHRCFSGSTNSCPINQD